MFMRLATTVPTTNMVFPRTSSRASPTQFHTRSSTETGSLARTVTGRGVSITCPDRMSTLMIYINNAVAILGSSKASNTAIRLLSYLLYSEFNSDGYLSLAKVMAKHQALDVASVLYMKSRLHLQH
ncbi:hypothetical protein BC936DRAFT_145548 [Jimgerdemannia flammicorona]|uniref:Uncharacterized protein n=1 Tax=Jimgerdemannia flammicorona TaxID=994334 RepID=A0A433D9S3_9FUNG|nr:hypothetical protein BC936DRAFT_145548 [Jimgerdemannia flammicorona]